MRGFVVACDSNVLVGRLCSAKVVLDSVGDVSVLEVRLLVVVISSL